MSSGVQKPVPSVFSFILCSQPTQMLKKRAMMRRKMMCSLMLNLKMRETSHQMLEMKTTVVIIVIVFKGQTKGLGAQLK